MSCLPAFLVILFLKVLSHFLTTGRALQSSTHQHIAQSRNELSHFILFFYICQILIVSIYALNKFSVNIFTLHVIFQYYFIESKNFDANSHWLGSAKVCPPPYLLLVFQAYRKKIFLINFLIIDYQVKFNYSLWTSYHTCEIPKVQKPQSLLANVWSKESFLI